MKLLILAIDAMAPNILFKYIDQFPTFRKLIEEGAYGSLQTEILPRKEYRKEGIPVDKFREEKRGYGSIACWYTFYTGLHPYTLNIRDGYLRSFVNKNRYKWIEDFRAPDKKLLLWQKLNKIGLSFGIVNGFFIKAQEINGFIWSKVPSSWPGGNYWPYQLKDIVPKYKFKEEAPKNAEELGIIKLTTKNGSEGFNEEDMIKLREAKDKIPKKLPGLYWKNKLRQIKYEAKYYPRSVEKIFSEIGETDVLMIYTAALDAIQHFQWHEEGHNTIIKSYQAWDSLLAKMIRKHDPENILVLSDHGSGPYSESSAQKEHYIKVNDNLTITGKTPYLAIVSGRHTLDGIFILKGPKIKRNHKAHGAALIDMHPTILTALGVNSSEKTEGKVIKSIFR